MKGNRILSLLVLSISTSSSWAQQIEFTATLPMSAAPSTQSVQLPAFDPALGILRNVQVTYGGSLTGTLALENTDPVPRNAPTTNLVVYLSGSMPGGFLAPPPNPAFEYAPFPPVSIGAFDGTLDFAGPSALSLPFQNATGTGAPSMTYNVIADSALPNWVGPAGAPGLLVFSVTVSSLQLDSLPSSFQSNFAATVDVNLRVRYTYETLPTAICRGTALAVCPCLNPSSTGSGCANSAGTQGGSLSVSGSSSISNDTLVLLGAGMPSISPVLYFQGTTFSYAQTGFGDGLLCVGGTITRLGLKFNAAGSSSYPQAGDPAISFAGGVTMPTQRYYQAYYRDAAAFCTPATFNLTNGYAVAWAP